MIPVTCQQMDSSSFAGELLHGKYEWNGIGVLELCSCIIHWSQEGYILLFRARSGAVCSPRSVWIVWHARPRRLMYHSTRTTHDWKLPIRTAPVGVTGMSRSPVL
jgi:hypothetical protein